jgi:TRAP-type C4-dicarboxylate transport system permease small subunit
MAIRMAGGDEVSNMMMDDSEDLEARGWFYRLEELSAAIFFAGMIITVLVGIFWRFVLESPLVWTINVSTLCFMWAVLLGSPLSDRKDKHLQFDLLYRIVPARVQLAFRLFGNTLLVAVFLVILPATLRFLLDVGGRTVTGVPWLNFSWAYSVFLIFLVLTVVSRMRLLLADLRMLSPRRWRE